MIRPWTLTFMPPEQIRDSKRIDYRADLYALGITLYYMPTKKMPFTGSRPLRRLWDLRFPLKVQAQHMCILRWHRTLRNPRLVLSCLSPNVRITGLVAIQGARQNRSFSASFSALAPSLGFCWGLFCLFAAPKESECTGADGEEELENGGAIEPHNRRFCVPRRGSRSR